MITRPCQREGMRADRGKAGPGRNKMRKVLTRRHGVNLPLTMRGTRFTGAVGASPCGDRGVVGNLKFRIAGKSYVLFVLMPEPPIAEWLAELNAWIQRFPGFFEGKPVVLDLSKQALAKPAIVALIGALKTRKIVVTAIEGVDSALLDHDLPPLLSGGRPTSAPEHRETGSAEPAADGADDSPGSGFLLLDRPVRSGQSVVFMNGDVTIVGSIASGAEVVAGGSIHVYGSLRGRALAGVSGNTDARIFCRNFNAELVAIGGVYTTANDKTSGLCGQPVQAWLDPEGETLQMRVLD